jgi:hypothetical protein
MSNKTIQVSNLVSNFLRVNLYYNDRLEHAKSLNDTKAALDILVKVDADEAAYIKDAKDAINVYIYAAYIIISSAKAFIPNVNAPNVLETHIANAKTYLHQIAASRDMDIKSLMDSLNTATVDALFMLIAELVIEPAVVNESTATNDETADVNDIIDEDTNTDIVNENDENITDTTVASEDIVEVIVDDAKINDGLFTVTDYRIKARMKNKLVAYLDDNKLELIKTAIENNEDFATDEIHLEALKQFITF